MNSRILGLVAGRLGVAAMTLLIVSLVVFGATQMLPGDVAEILLGQAATPEAVAGLRQAMHLDQPALFQYAHWLWGLAHGDLGCFDRCACKRRDDSRAFSTQQAGQQGQRGARRLQAGVVAGGREQRGLLVQRLDQAAYRLPCLTRLGLNFFK